MTVATPAERRGGTLRNSKAGQEPASQDSQQEGARSDGVDEADIVDGAIVEPEPGAAFVTDEDWSGTPTAAVVPITTASRERDKDKKAKSGPPTVGEWQDFISGIVIRMATDYYGEWVFNGIDDTLVSDNDAVRIRLTDDECDTIGKPIAELFNKLAFTRKHGRAIIGGAGSLQSMVILGRWFSRVNRLARKYHGMQRPETPRPQYPQTAPEPGGESPYVANGQSPPPSSGTGLHTVVQPGTG
jgi:hypothetical protein